MRRHFDEDLPESPEPGSTDFRVTLKLQSSGKEPARELRRRVPEFTGRITG